MAWDPNKKTLSQTLDGSSATYTPTVSTSPTTPKVSAPESPTWVNPVKPVPVQTYSSEGAEKPTWMSNPTSSAPVTNVNTTYTPPTTNIPTTPGVVSPSKPTDTSYNPSGTNVSGGTTINPTDALSQALQAIKGSSEYQAMGANSGGSNPYLANGGTDAGQKKNLAAYLEKTLGIDLGSKDMAGSADDEAKIFADQQKRKMSELENQVNAAKDNAVQRSAEEQSATTAGMAQNREGAFSQGNVMAATGINTSIQSHANQQLMQLNSQLEDAKAQLADNNKNFVAGRAEAMTNKIATISQQMATVQKQAMDAQDMQMKQQQNSMTLLKTLSDTGGLANLSPEDVNYLQSGMKDVPPGILQAMTNAATRNYGDEKTKQQITNLNSFADLASKGVAIPTESIFKMAASTGLPAEMLYQTSQLAQQVMADKSLSSQEKQAQVANLMFDLNQKQSGIFTEAGKKTAELANMYKNGASPEMISAYKSAAGITDYDDPMTKAKLGVEQANATLKGYEASYAGGVPPEGSKEYFDYLSAKSAAGKAQLELNDLMPSGGQAEDHTNSVIVNGGYSTDSTNVGGNKIVSTTYRGVKMPSDQPVVAKVGNKDIKAQPVFMSALQKADADMFAATGQHLQIGENFRTTDHQQAIRDKFGYTSNSQASGAGGRPMAAPPGTSFHERGLAIDVANWQAAAPFLAKYGIVGGLKNDMNHFSMGEINPQVFSSTAVSNSTSLGGGRGRGREGGTTNTTINNNNNQTDINQPSVADFSPKTTGDLRILGSAGIQKLASNGTLDLTQLSPNALKTLNDTMGPDWVKNYQSSSSTGGFTKTTQMKSEDIDRQAKAVLDGKATLKELGRFSPQVLARARELDTSGQFDSNQWQADQAAKQQNAGVYQKLEVAADASKSLFQGLRQQQKDAYNKLNDPLHSIGNTVLAPLSLLGNLGKGVQRGVTENFGNADFKLPASTLADLQGQIGLVAANGNAPQNETIHSLAQSLDLNVTPEQFDQQLKGIEQAMDAKKKYVEESANSSKSYGSYANQNANTTTSSGTVNGYTVPADLNQNI